MHLTLTLNPLKLCFMLFHGQSDIGFSGPDTACVCVCVCDQIIIFDF